jgi:hypothetical protein
MLAILVGWALLAVGAASHAAQDAASRDRYAIEATLDADEAAIRGTVRIAFTNDGPDPLERAYLHLYPNRFQRDGSEVNDITRMHVYPYGIFQPGGVVLGDSSTGGGEPAAHRVVERPGVPEDTVLEVDLGTPVPPGGRGEIVVAFESRLPERFGPFGVTEYGYTAVAGWYPYLVARDRDGAWRFTAGPPPGDVQARVTAPADLTLVLGSRVFAPPHAGTVEAAASDVRTFALVALREASVTSSEAGGTRVTFVEPAPLREHRIGPEPDPHTVLQEAVVRAIALRPETVAAPPALTVLQVPLRWNLTTPSDGLVVISDRAMRVHALLRGFHEAQVAQAVYAELLRAQQQGCPEPQPRWVIQGVAWQLADRYLARAQPEHRSVHEWIDWFDVFAIVDRFETAPKVPFVQSFFANAPREDDLRENVFSVSGDEPPPRLVFARLEQQLGDAVTASAVDGWLAAPCEPFAAAVAGASGDDPQQVASALDAARVPSPERDVPFGVDATVAPARERSRYQIVLDTADVEVSSTEFGLAALFVARRRYDYTKDLALNPYLTERAYGFHAGPRVHFGARNDPNTYRHNLFAFYNFAWLDRGFKDDSEPEVRTSGNVAGFGLRYDYSNVYAYDNPTEQREARAFVDWHDPAFGGDYGFVRFGARGTATTPIFRPTTIGAIELLVGFAEDTNRRGMPIQEQYSLGGRRALRGVSVNERLERNIGLARFEVRQDVYPEVDFDFLDLAVYRRPQIKLFLDTGQVDDSAGRALNPAHFALAAGVGVNVLYDFLGFFPGRAYIELATRLDRDQTDFQVLFGTRQAF